MNSGHRIVVVGGFSSNVGKTTLACRLLSAVTGWEAVKVTKGHYRSCGKDPEACCVSHLLSDAPLVLSGRKANDTPGKDTGRFWESGASNVHWVVATRQRVADGVLEALSRVAPSAPGVVIEGTGIASAVESDLFVLVARRDQDEVKKSAVRMLERADAIVVSGSGDDDDAAIERITALACAHGYAGAMPRVIFERDITDRPLEEMRKLCASARDL